MDAFINIIKDVGFPIFVAVFLLWQQRDLKKIINRNSEVIGKICEKLDIKEDKKEEVK
jgi:hypothetical protein